MKKRIIFFVFTIFCLALISGAVVGCNKGSNSAKIKIVASIFPEYDWVKNIAEGVDGVEVKLLLDSGADLHSFQPSVQDIAEVASCDLFIYVGGESDEWVEDALKNAVSRNMRTLNLIEVLGDKAKEEEIIEGMEGEDHDHEEGEEGHEEGEDHDHEEPEYDEHVWLSLKNARIFVDAISSELSKIDEANAAKYAQNAENYKHDIASLDADFEKAVGAAAKDTLLFGDRFPFRYLVDDYGLKYYAAFVGCSAETEASFETIAFLAQKTDELSLDVILKIEDSDGKIANTIKNNTKNKNQTVLTMDSLQSSTLKEYAAGRTYLSVMRANLEVLRQALA